MSWTYLLEEEEACWREPSLTGAPSALLKLIPTDDLLYSLDNEMESYQDFPSGMTFEPSMDPLGKEKSTSSPEDSPVKTSVQRVSVEDLPESIRALSSRCSELLEKCNLRLCSRKTVRNFVPMDSVRSSTDLPAWGTWDVSGYWELGTSVRTMKENECGLLPTLRANRWGLEDSHGDTSKWDRFFQKHDMISTPTCQGNDLAPCMQKWPGHRRLMNWLDGLPTPTASDAKRGVHASPSDAKRHCPPLGHQVAVAIKGNILPAPTAQLYGSNQGEANGRNGRKRKSLEGLTGGVFIALREWMMGWPLGWSSLNPLPKENFDTWKSNHKAGRVTWWHCPLFKDSPVETTHKQARVRCTGDGWVPEVARVVWNILGPGGEK